MFDENDLMEQRTVYLGEICRSESKMGVNICEFIYTF